MSNSTDSLLAELDAEFGKQKKEKAEKHNNLKQVAKKLERSQFTNNADWRLAMLMQESNAIAQSENFSELWKTEARETWLMQQHCLCCGGVTEYIAGEYIRFRNIRAHAIMKRRIEKHPDIFHFNREVPEEFIQLEQDVARCVKCINEEKQFDEIWTRIFPPEKQSEQLEIPGLEQEKQNG